MSSVEVACSSIDEGNYRYLQDLIYRGSGIVLDGTKQYLFEARLGPIARDRGVPSVNDLCRLMRATGEPSLCVQAVEAMTINETYFYRDPAQFELVRTELLPRLRFERGPGDRRLRFWSAAASTGQEAYSLAIDLQECGFADWDWQVLGTDLCSAALARAREGIYLPNEAARGLPAHLAGRYLTRTGEGCWQIDEPVRLRMIWERADLRAPAEGRGLFDLVMCRNVLVYFDEVTRRSVFETLRRAMAPGAWLLLGTAETCAGSADLFESQPINGVPLFLAR